MNRYDRKKFGMIFAFKNILGHCRFKNQMISAASVIPMKIGIRYFEYVLDTGFRRYDEHA